MNRCHNCGRVAVDVPPRKFELYLDEMLPNRVKEYAREFQRIIRTVQQAPETLREEDLWELSLDSDKKIDEYLEYTEPKKNTSASSYTIPDLLDTIDLKKRLIFGDSLRYSSSDMADELAEYLRRFASGRFVLENMIEAIDSRIIDNLEFELQQDYYSRREVKNALAVRELPGLWKSFQESLFEAADKLEAAATRLRNEEPQTEDVEVLYHASVNAREIAGEGFDEEVPGHGGIGGAQTTGEGVTSAGTSFTADLYVAKEIMRALKEVTMIAQGDLGLRGIKNMAKEEGIWDELKSERMYNKPLRSEGRPSPDELFAMYNAYIWLSDRYNPVFMGGDQAVYDFADVDRSDIGVVEAVVDMEHPHIEYMDSMEEYRVPPEAIIEVTDFIR